MKSNMIDKTPIGDENVFHVRYHVTINKQIIYT